MTSDSYDASLKRLMVLTPDADRAAHVRARCRAQLERNRQREMRHAEVVDFAWRVLAPVVVGAFSVFYAVELLTTTLRLQGVF